MLASLADYAARYGAPADPTQVETELDAASSLVQEVAKQDLVRIVDDVVEVEGDGSDLLQLPQLPSISVSQVLVDGVELDASGWRLIAGGHGQLLREHGCWPEARPVTVTNTHGFDPIPGWIVSLVCAMVQRATREETIEGISQESTGAQSIAYVSTAAGAAIWVTRGEAARLENIFGPTIG